MGKELNIFFNALMYYSRIPVPKSIYCSEQILSKAFRYYPLVGVIVASLGVGFLLLANHIFPEQISILIALFVMIFFTGCIHEDGFADFFDGFGGGYSKESILRIMKDSHIGTYGVIALIFLFLFKFLALTSISFVELPLVIIAASGVSRIFPILLVKYSNYARESDSKAQHTRKGVDNLTLFVAFFLGSLPLLFFNYKFVILYLLVSIIFFISFRFYLHKKINGFTGDTLGALQQFEELFFYLTYIALYKL